MISKTEIKYILAELDFSFIRGSGPGGQKVNKVSTAVQLKFDVENSQNFPEVFKSKLLKAAGKKSTNDGVIIIEAKRYRTQEKNKSDAISRFLSLMNKSMLIKKARKKTKPTKASSENRLDQKKKISNKKNLRKYISKDFE